MVTTARAIFGSAACSLAVLTADATELVFTTVSGEGQDAVTGLRIPSSSGIAGWVVMSGQAVAVAEPGRDPRFAADVATSTGYLPASILAAPVATERRVLGVMEVLDRDATRAGAADDLQLLALFAGQAALAIEANGVFESFGAAVLRAAAAAIDRREDESAPPEAQRTLEDDADRARRLADALREAASAEEADIGSGLLLTAVVTELSALGATEQRLAVGVLSEVTGYLRGRERRLD
jgi:GAF domain-containing protein